MQCSQGKIQYESDLIFNYANHSNPVIYHYIRSFTKSATIPSTVYLDANSDLTKANLFNQYFYSVFTPPPSVPDHTAATSHLSTIYSLDLSVLCLKPARP